MDTAAVCLRVAGVLQLLVASANLFAVREFGYREELAKVSPVVREVFVVQNVYTVLVVVAAALLCLARPAELAGGGRLGAPLSAFLAFFWGLRVVIQVFVYDPETKRRYPALNALFLATFVYLTAVFAAAASGRF